MHAFARFAPEVQVMAASLAFSLAHLTFRLPLGLGSARYFVKKVLATGGEPNEKSSSEKNAPAAVSSHA